MVNENYTSYGEEWKKEMSKLTKAEIIEIASKIGQDNERLKKIALSSKYPDIEANGIVFCGKCGQQK